MRYMQNSGAKKTWHHLKFLNIIFLRTFLELQLAKFKNLYWEKKERVLLEQIEGGSHHPQKNL